MLHYDIMLSILVSPSDRTLQKASIRHSTDLVEEEVIDVVGEEGSELALLGLAWPHVHLYLLNEPGQKTKHEN